MNSIIIGSSIVNSYSLASFYAVRRIFSDRNIILPKEIIPDNMITNNTIKTTIKTIMKDTSIIQNWTLEYLHSPQDIDLEFLELDYNHHVKKFLCKHPIEF